MKLVFVHDHKFRKYKEQYYSTGGLAGEALKRYIDAFGNVTIVARCIEISEYNQSLSLSSIEGTRFINVPNHKSIKSFYKLNEVKSILENEIADADYVIARVSSLGHLAVKYAKKYNKPYLVEVVGCTWDALWNYNIKGKVLAPISYFIQKRIVRNAPYVIYVTNNFLQKRYSTRGKSVDCSNVSLTDFDENIIKKRIEKISNMKFDKKVIIGTTAAVDVKYKGQQTVIKALGILKKQGFTNFEYQLVGGGDPSFLKSEAKKYKVSNQIKFLGSMPHKDIFEWLDTIDIYIQPSKTEGLPRALIEAMSRGLPAIGNNVGGIPELLDKSYILGKTTNKSLEISELLKNINRKGLLQQADRNFSVSKEYKKVNIESRRMCFFERFINENKVYSKLF